MGVTEPPLTFAEIIPPQTQSSVQPLCAGHGGSALAWVFKKVVYVSFRG